MACGRAPSAKEGKAVVGVMVGLPPVQHASRIRVNLLKHGVRLDVAFSLVL